MLKPSPEGEGFNPTRTCDNKNIAHLNNTANHIDTLIAQFSSFPIPRPSVEEDAFSNVLISFKEQAESVIKSLSEKKQQLETQLKELSVVSSDVGQQFGQLLSSVNQQGEAIEKTGSFRNCVGRFMELRFHLTWARHYM